MFDSSCVESAVKLVIGLIIVALVCLPFAVWKVVELCIG